MLTSSFTAIWNGTLTITSATKIVNKPNFSKFLTSKHLKTIFYGFTHLKTAVFQAFCSKTFIAFSVVIVAISEKPTE